jgi:hypothetical protein
MSADPRIALKNLAPSQLPEFVRAEYPTFVAFVEAYYEYLDSQTVDMEDIRDIDSTLDEYIKYFKAELAHNYPVVSTDSSRERFLLKHIKEQYLAKGSEASYKLLFRLLYGKDVFIDYPGRQMLRVSDGRWTQDVSIFVKVSQGDPNELIGKTIGIQTGKKIFNTNVLVGADTFSGVTASVQKAVVVNEALDIWELFLDRNFYGDISPNNTVKYGSSFQATILPNTAKIKISDPGKNFRPGMVFQLNTGEGTPFWFKVATVTDTGGLKTIDVIKFGLFYNTNFSVTVLPTSAATSKVKRTTTVSDLTYTVNSNGKIVYYDLLTSGQNYQSPPLVILTGNGTGAAAHSVIVDGKVTEVVVDSFGEGYTTIYAQLTNAPGDFTGNGASVKPIIGSDYDYKFVDKTSGFTESGYVNMGDYWDVTESGKGASAVATLGSGLTAGQITSISITNGGSGYNYSKPIIDICTPLGANGIPINGGVKATAEAVVTDGVITGVNITNHGSGYLTPPLIKVIGSYGYANGGYAGTIARQFFINANDTLGENPAILNVSLDAVSKYPGYYKTNDGFLDDSMFIQDSYYYQAFAYVLKIDEQLQKYASVVRSMLHPSGMAMFGEYSINNKIQLGVGLKSLVKSLGVTLYDSVVADDGYELDSNGNVIRGTYFSAYKYLEITYGTGATGYDISANYHYPSTQGLRWTQNTAFNLNQLVFYEGSLYRVTTAGVSAADDVVYNSTTGSRTVVTHPPTNNTVGSSAANGSLVLLNIGKYDGFSDSIKFNTTKSFGAGTPWYASTPVILDQFIYNANKYYSVVTAGVTGLSAPSHTTGDVTNGTAVLRYVGTTATSLASTAQYSDIVSKLWTSNTTVSRHSVLYYNNRKYVVTTEGVTGNTPPTNVLTTQNNGTCQLQYIGTDVSLVADGQGGQVAQYTNLVGDPTNTVNTTELRNYVFGKAIGLTGQTETVFMTDLVTKYFGKSVLDSTSLIENFTKLLISKSFTDFAPIGDTPAITFTLNTINDPTSGVYLEEGYIIYNPYDEGSYQAEHYANERPSTISS